MIRTPASIFHPGLKDLTENERAWVGFLRLVTHDTDPAPTLARVQALRCVFSDSHSSGEDRSLEGP
jgi:hypothetical protein